VTHALANARPAQPAASWRAVALAALALAAVLLPGAAGLLDPAIVGRLPYHEHAYLTSDGWAQDHGAHGHAHRSPNRAEAPPTRDADVLYLMPAASLAFVTAHLSFQHGELPLPFPTLQPIPPWLLAPYEAPALAGLATPVTVPPPR